ncbi:MAG: ribosome-binding factor A [Candidatus Calescibacterium sp.]|nr:ribosome-binding factor A [Candidatus Calescibacterium sp.]MCX7971972.1 ribosome-binding factor A [bacterium]MDW8195442.1 ribosome-binding factor A [Candidatus Calescibacterium sp.]
MNPQRIEKIRKLLHREVSMYIQNEMGLRDLQINRVLFSPDLKKAKFIFVYISNNSSDNKHIEDFLNKNSSRIRSSMFKLLRLRFVPEFIFEYEVVKR